MKTKLLLIAMILPLCVSGENYFTDGMKWEMSVIGTQDPTATTAIETVTIDGDTVVDGLPALKMYRTIDGDDNSSTLITLIRNDGNKVYFTPVQSSTSDWYLFYDFGLEPGEGCYVYSPTAEPNDDGTPYASYLKCTSTVSNNEDFGGWSTIALEEYATDDCEDLRGNGTWIIGLGSTNGVLENNRFNIDGYGSTLIISNGDEILYAHGTSGINDIDQSCIKIRRTGLNIYISNIGVNETISLYAINGILLKSIKSTNAETLIKLPKAGIYLIKAGERTQKILAY